LVVSKNHIWCLTVSLPTLYILWVFQTDAAPVPPVDEQLDKAIKKDLSKRGLPEVKIPKPKTKKALN
tara:strand:- start:280 stop:480 length:201 start_codon:yes stop_codon:yes gene_type:complete